jgi:hypothetical protein
MRTIDLVVPLLTAATLAACTTPDTAPETIPAPPPEALPDASPDAPPGPPSEHLAVATSLEVTATLSFTREAPYGISLPDSERFLLRLDGEAGQSVTALWANDEGAADGVFVRTDAGASMRELVVLPVVFGDHDEFGSGPSITFDSMLLALQDSDGDGNADTVTGSGSGSLYYILGDVPYTSEFTAEIRGDRDATPPALSVAGNDTSLHVLDGLRVVASEPLRPGSTARAWHGDAPIDLTAFPGGGKYVRSFTSSAVLPFDAELRIEIDPVPQDLGGLAAATGQLTARTMPSPGVFAEDGFEGDPLPAIGGAAVVTGVGTLPAIAGARSLLVEPEDGLIMHIPLTGGETHLRFRARMLFEESGGCPTHRMRVGSPGVGGGQSVSIGLGYGPVEDTGDTSWGAAGPIGALEVAIPAGASGDLVFEIYATPPVQPPCPGVAFLIDDLRAE